MNSHFISQKKHLSPSIVMEVAIAICLTAQIGNAAPITTMILPGAPPEAARVGVPEKSDVISVAHFGLKSLKNPIREDAHGDTPTHLDCSGPTADGTYDAQTLADTAITCVGWLRAPEKDQHKLFIYVASGPNAAINAKMLQGDVGAVANELFSLIAEIAVDKAEREGLALVHDKITDLTCETDLKIPGVAYDPQKPLHLDQTCALFRNTDLQTLIGQGQALRSAISGDLVSIADDQVATQFKDVPPLAGGALAGLALLKRVVTDPNMHLTREDEWTFADAVINATWDDQIGPLRTRSFLTDHKLMIRPSVDAKGNPITVNDTTAEKLAALRMALAAARSYVQAIQWANIESSTRTASQIDPAYILKTIFDKYCASDSQTRTEDCPFPKELTSDLPKSLDTRRVMAEWADLAIKGVTALTTDRTQEDYKTRLRSLIQLVFQSYGIIAATDRETEKVELFSTWAQLVAVAALDADAPHLISAIADISKTIGESACNGHCRQERKLTALLSAISTYAMTYVQIPKDASGQDLASLQQQQHDMRKQALESAIDAATDRRAREGDRVLSLGTGVGFSYSFSISGFQDVFSKPQLHLPLGLAFQQLPGKWQGHFWKLPMNWLGWHTMITAADLGNYVRSSNTSTTKIKWQSIIAPGAEAGIAIGKPNTFFVLGYNFDYSPQFATTNLNGSSLSKATTKQGVFVQYYFPLWDFN